jgi:hypothetical protein
MLFAILVVSALLMLYFTLALSTLFIDVLPQIPNDGETNEPV